MVTFASVWIAVLRAPMRCTVPRNSPTRTKSPARIGRSTFSRSPLTKLFAMFWRPKPMPTPSTLPRMASERTSTPQAWSTTIAPRKTSV